MKSLALLLPTLLAHGDAPKPQMSCTAVFRTLDERNNTVERTAALSVKAVIGDQLKHEARLEGKLFTLTEERSGDLFAQITNGPDFTRGTVVRGTADSLGRFTATEVNGPTVYRLECARE